MLKRQWVTPDGRARVEVSPKGDTNDTEVLRSFARAVLAVYPNATGGPISILESSRTIVRAFLEAGFYALISIAILLWIVLRRFGDVLLTLVPLLLAGVVTLEICVLIGMPLNFANIIALPLLLGVGVAFKIYYIMAWRSGRTNLLQSSLTRAVIWSALDHGNGVREPVAVAAPGHVEHGQAARAVARVYAGGGGAISARAHGEAPPGQELLGTRPALDSGCVPAVLSAEAGRVPVVLRGGRRFGRRFLRRCARRRIGCVRTAPVLASAQEAEKATLHLQRIGIGQADIGGISVAVFRIVDLHLPICSCHIGSASCRGESAFPKSGAFVDLGPDSCGRTPGVASHATTPHMRPSQSTILIRATCLATSHSPVGPGVEIRAGWAVAAPAAISQTTNAAERGFLMPVLWVILFGTCAETWNMKRSVDP